MPNQLLRSLPSIERLLERPLASQLSVDLSRDRVRDLLRQITDELREEVVSGKWPPASGSERLIQEVELRLELRAAASAQPSLRRVINATGVIIHTNLGRAPLARQAIEAISEAAAYYSNLEYDLLVGERGQRETHCRALLARLAGSEAAVVANNNAAAVLLLLNTLAEGGEVIVSRGELIEIGGSFRIPDIMAKSGATLREVGTTNRTRIDDYRAGISSRTALLAKVHTSNYRIVGFVEETPLEELVALGRELGLPVFMDEGSGNLGAAASGPLAGEPSVSAAL